MSKPTGKHGRRKRRPMYWAKEMHKVWPVLAPIHLKQRQELQEQKEHFRETWFEALRQQKGG